MEKPNKSIVVGLLLNESDESLLRAAATLSTRWQAPVQLVHAIKPLFSYLGAGDVVINPYYVHETVINEKEEERAREKMAKVAKRFSTEVTTHILRDYAPEALLTVASETHARLLMCGIRVREASHILSGFSTAFTLAAEAEIPVMIVPLGSPLSFEPPLRLLVADNLEVEGRCALETALQLARDLQAETLNHTHVHNVTPKELDEMVESVKEGMILGKIPNNPDFTAEFYTETVTAKTREDLIYRFQNSAGVKTFQGRYNPEVAYGHPAVELRRLARETRSQLMIFGRHHILKRRNLTLGRVPYHAMINDGIATLVVPDMERNRSSR